MQQKKNKFVTIMTAGIFLFGLSLTGYQLSAQTAPSTTTTKTEIKTIEIARKMDKIGGIQSATLEPWFGIPENPVIPYKLKVSASFTNETCVPTAKQVVQNVNYIFKEQTLEKVEVIALQDTVFCTGQFAPVEVEFDLGILSFAKNEKLPLILVNGVEARIQIN